MFDDVINEGVIETLTNEELDQLIAMLEKAGYWWLMFLTTFALPAMSSLTLMKVASCGKASCSARTATLKSAPRIVKSVASKGSGGPTPLFDPCQVIMMY